MYTGYIEKPKKNLFPINIAKFSMFTAPLYKKPPKLL
jgi:hypothetical protein